MFNTKMRNHTLLLALVAATSLLFSACDKDEETAEENITTIEVHLTGPGFDQKFYWNDTDGDGGAAPTIDEITLPALTGNIACHLHVYDRSVTPEVDITEEIEAESADHLFVYTLTGATGLTLGDFNTDSNGARFGLTSTWETGQPGTGSLNIKLYHEPTDKSSTTAPGGDVDFDVTFPVKIQ
jgi:hypothetical protein